MGKSSNKKDFVSRSEQQQVKVAYAGSHWFTIAVRNRHFDINC